MKHLDNPYPYICPNCGATIYTVIRPRKCPKCGAVWPKEDRNPNASSGPPPRPGLKWKEETQCWIGSANVPHTVRYGGDRTKIVNLPVEFETTHEGDIVVSRPISIPTAERYLKHKIDSISYDPSESPSGKHLDRMTLVGEKPGERYHYLKKIESDLKKLTQEQLWEVTKNMRHSGQYKKDPALYQIHMEELVRRSGEEPEDKENRNPIAYGKIHPEKWGLYSTEKKRSTALRKGRALEKSGCRVGIAETIRHDWVILIKNCPQSNPILPVVLSAAISGVGLGVGFKSVDALWSKGKKAINGNHRNKK